MVNLREEIKAFVKENGFAESISTYDLLELQMKKMSVSKKLDINDVNQVHSFLNSFSVRSFCEKQQPFMDPVPPAVIHEICDYFKDSSNSLDAYTPITAYRSSNSKGDSHLYSILAKRHDGTYSCWTRFNTSLHSMNNGHYGLSKEEAISVIKEKFFDVTDCPEDPERYGMENSRVIINEDKEPEKVVNLAAIRARRGGR